MPLSTLFWSILAVAVVVFLPIMLIWSMVDHFRGNDKDGKKRERRGGGGVSAGIGASLQELDRIVARPSVEFRVEAEQPILKREDDAGGD
jgi:hypothetical protein